MKRNSYVHCSFDLVESFKPRVPKTRVIGKFVSEEARHRESVLLIPFSMHYLEYQDVQMSCKIFKNLTCVFIFTYTI